MKELETMLKKGLLDPVIEKALELMQEADSDQELARLHSICSDVMFRKGQYNDAADYGQKASDKDPENGEALAHLGWAEYWLGRNDSALEHLEKACELQPESAENHYRLGSLLSNALGKLPEAEEEFTKAIEIDPGHSLAWQQRGIARWNRGDRDGAGHDYRNGAAAGDPWCGYILEYNGFPLESPLEKLALARDCWGQNQSQRAVELLREALAEGFQDPEKQVAVRLELADYLSIMKIPSEAEEEYAAAIAEAPENPDGYGRRGWHFYSNSMDDNAGKDYRRAMELDPDNSLFPARLGNLYAVAGKPEEGIPVLDRAIEKDPFSPDLFYSRALCRMKTGDDEGAKEDFINAEFLGHRNAHADRRQVYGDSIPMDFFSAGIEAGDRGEFSLAAENFSKAASMFDSRKNTPGDLNWRYAAKCYHNLGHYLHMQGGLDAEAETNLKKSVEMVPFYKDAWITLGNVYNVSGRQTEALDCYERAIELQANDGRGYYSRGRVYLAMQDFDRGVDDFSRAIALYNRRDWQGDAYYNRAKCHEGAGRIEEAVSDYNQAFNLGIQQGIHESMRLKDTFGLD